METETEIGKRTISRMVGIRYEQHYTVTMFVF